MVMFTFIERAALAAVGLEVLVVASGAGLPQHTLGALNKDDACAVGSHEPRGGCALQALQQRSARGLVADTPAPQAEPAPQEDDNPWIWDERTIRTQYNLKPEPKAIAAGTMDDDAQSVTQGVTYFCERWMAYNWAKVSFWSQQLLRRADALPAAPSPQQQEDFQRFAHQASYLTCIYDFDPQQGTEWSPHVAEYMTKVAAAPADNLQLPKLEGWFTQMPQALDLYSIDACMLWVTDNFCDMGFLARELRGNKEYDGVCWDKVPRRQYNMTVANNTIDLPFNLHVFAQDDDFEHPEFERCQEKPFSRDVVQNNCPMFGHYPTDMWGLTNFSWGDVPKKNSKRYNEVLSCSKKLGLPESARMNLWDSFPYADNVGLMDTPTWRLQQVNEMQNTRNRILGDVKRRLNSTLNGVKNVINTTDWTTITNQAFGTWASPESQAAWQAVYDEAKAAQATANYSKVISAMGAAMGTANLTSATQAMWGLTGAYVRGAGTVVGNQIAGVFDVMGDFGRSINNTIRQVNYSDVGMQHVSEEDLSLRPKESTEAQDQPTS